MFHVTSSSFFAVRNDLCKTWVYTFLPLSVKPFIPRAVLHAVSQHIQSVRQLVQNGVQALLNRFGAAGQVDDQRLPPEYGYAPREHGAPGDPQGVGADGLGNARRLPFRHGQRDLRRLIPGGKACAAGGQNEIQPPLVAQAQKLFPERMFSVRQQQRFDDFIARRRKPPHDGRARKILPLARAP